MIIKEVIARECCDDIKDLVPSPIMEPRLRWWEMTFKCKHCKTVWEWETYMDAAGGTSKRLIKTPNK